MRDSDFPPSDLNNGKPLGGTRGKGGGVLDGPIEATESMALRFHQTCVMRQDFDSADQILATIPKEHRNRVAHFLEKQGRNRGGRPWED